MGTLTGVHTIHQGECLELFKFASENHTNVLVLGPAGGGKTAMAQQAANESDLPHIYIDLSVLEAPDFVGLPTIEKSDHGGKFVEYATPRFMPTIDTVDTSKKPFVLVFDELDKSRPELQAPLLEIFHERSINGRKLHVGGILATGNLPDEGAFSQPISHALTNRCSVYKMDLIYDDWQPWAVKNGVNPLIVGFLSRNPEWLLKAPPEGDPTAYCHASPRAWSNAARDIDKAGSKASVLFQSKLVAGRVGTAAASNFQVWLDHYRHIEPMIDELVKSGKHPDDNMTIDRRIVCAISACSQIASTARKVTEDVKRGGKKDSEKVLKVTANVMGWLSTQPTEFQIAAIKNTLDMEVIKEFALTKNPQFMASVSKVRDNIK